MGHPKSIPHDLHVVSSRSVTPRQRHRRWIWILVLILLGSAVAIRLLISNAESILRARVVDTLATRFNSRVELAGFHVWFEHGLHASGEGLRVYRKGSVAGQVGAYPLIGIENFYFHTSWPRLLESPMRVHTVYVEGLQLHIPPKEERQQVQDLRSRAGKIRITVDEFLCENALLLIEASRVGKPPLDFEIPHLTLQATGPNQPWHFDATLVNPKPVGDIQSSGSFGPWQADAPRDTPVAGRYSFTNADLGTLKGIGGMLSSIGNFTGSLGQIVVDGETDTPDFHLDVSVHPVPLHTQFHAIVDGTSGDTYLEPVRARLLHSSLVARGYVVRLPGPKRHEIKLDVVVSDGRIEDLLQVSVRTTPPIMTGAVQLKTKFDLPPGGAEIAERLRLAGVFHIQGAQFTSEKIQRKIDALSLRSQGKPQLAKQDVLVGVASAITGEFTLRNALLSFSRLQFEVPGAQVEMAGVYSLDGNRFNFHGKARLQAKLSQMVTGWKSILLKPVDPFFSKDGAGTELPVKITGTKSEPHFGLDFGHKKKAE
jgi:hypothetical protein